MAKINNTKENFNEIIKKFRQKSKKIKTIDSLKVYNCSDNKLYSVFLSDEELINKDYDVDPLQNHYVIVFNEFHIRGLWQRPDDLDDNNEIYYCNCLNDLEELCEYIVNLVI